MREEGFEPSQALSYIGLNDARLTTPAFPRAGRNFNRVINVIIEETENYLITEDKILRSKCF